MGRCRCRRRRGRVLQEVRVQQVVVAGRRVLRTASSADALGDRVHGFVLGRDVHPMPRRLGPVILHHLMRIELAGDGRGRMKPAQGLGHSPEHLGSPHLIDRDRAAFDEARHQPALSGDEGHDFRPHSHLERAHPRRVLDRTVDAQEVGFGAAHPKHEHPAIHGDLVVAVGDPAPQLGHCCITPRPQPFDRLSRGVHKSRIVSAFGPRILTLRLEFLLAPNMAA